MKTDEKIELLKAREYQIIKHNDLVLKSRYNYTVTEQKTIAYVCSMIKPIEALDRATGVPFALDYDFNIMDYARICGFSSTGGKLYDEIKATLKKLSDRSFWVEIEDEDVLCRWFAKVRTNKRSGIAHIRLDEDLVPYLFDLQNRYLSFGIKNVMLMKCQYSQHLYEILKAYCDMKVGQTDKRNKAEKDLEPRIIHWTMELEDLKKRLMVENNKTYSNFYDFKKRVLLPAQKEINNYTDMNVYFEPILKGRKTVKIKWKIVHKEMIERISTEIKQEELLGEIK